MTRARPIIVGPYEFSPHDARSSFAEASDLLAEFPESTHPAHGVRFQIGAVRSVWVCAIARPERTANAVVLEPSA